ncbi:uncharacterized protein LOC114458888 isoform X4 [Gouania willdenowi]|uniref:uncharacterized protein LOC114458888 isoform X4 n=1 Tax=Gouania willdenowi TaxID=441366 RepID=UPI0010569A25|nr:uncharacterized protein LOC114458888 isoform X4 [Gouania willdenowi]
MAFLWISTRLSGRSWSIFKTWTLFSSRRLERTLSLHWLLEEPPIHEARLDVQEISLPGLSHALTSTEPSDFGRLDSLRKKKRCFTTTAAEWSSLMMVILFLSWASHWVLAVGKWRRLIYGTGIMLGSGVHGWDLCFTSHSIPKPEGW